MVKAESTPIVLIAPVWIALTFLEKEIWGPAAKRSSSKGNDRLQSIRVVIVGDIGQPCGAKVFSSHSWNGRKIRCDE